MSLSGEAEARKLWSESLKARDHLLRENYNIKTDKTYENVAKFKYFGTTLTNQRITIRKKLRAGYIRSSTHETDCKCLQNFSM
jgi:ribosomal protein L4